MDERISRTPPGLGEEWLVRCPRCGWEGWRTMGTVGGRPLCTPCYGRGPSLGGHAVELEFISLAGAVAMTEEVQDG
jgi:hypothetical protein